MTKLLVFLALAGLAAVAFADEETNDARPVMYEFLRDNGFGRLLDFGCDIRNILKDQEFSDHSYAVMDAVKAFFREGGQCIHDEFVAALNDKEKNIGRLVTALRMGDTTPVESLGEVFRYFGISQLIFFSTNGARAFEGIEPGKLRTEFRDLMKQIVQDCGSSRLEAVKPDIEFVQGKLREMVEKNEQ